jgi:L-lactate dehydrogenase complex protein LldG
MTTSRDAFLQRVRHAVRAGNRFGQGALEPRGSTGYQGAGPDPVARFRAECTAAGGVVAVVPDPETAAAHVLEILRARACRQVLVGRGPVLDGLGLPARLQSVGIEVLDAAARDARFAADAGVTGVDYLVAETGTIALCTRPDEPRGLSLLPPLHVAVAHRSQLLPDLFDLFEKLPAGTPLPSCLSLITGPSKTGDIELRLVTGVHGPGEVDVVLIDPSV